MSHGITVKIIGLSGLAGSGKSAITKYLVEQHGFVNAKFAGGLKVMTRAFLAYRGVDEATIERMIEGDLKEVSTRYLGGRSPRYFMQKLGHEFGRLCIHEDLWIDTTADHIAGLPKVVLDDTRYPNEAGLVWRHGGIVARVQRPSNNLDVGQHASEVMDFEADVHLLNNGSLESLFHNIEHRLILGNASPLQEAA